MASSASADFSTDYRALSADSRCGRHVVLACCVFVFLVQYMQSSPMLAPFLADSATGRAIGTDAVGVVFAAYPLATAIATPLPGRVIRRVGVRRTVCTGLCLTAAGAFAFGCIGVWAVRLQVGALVATVGLVVSRACGGLGAALAEAGSLTAISVAGWGDDLGKALSLVEVVTGVGAALGAEMGSVLYVIGAPTAVGAFLLPMLVASALPLTAMPLAIAVLDDATGEDDAGADAAAPSTGKKTEQEEAQQQHEPPLAAGEPPEPRVLPLSRACTAVSLGLSATVFEGLNPLLEPHLARRPYQLSVPQVGTLLSTVCVVYTCTALPAGWLSDKLNRGADAPARVRCLMIGGWLVALLTAALLWPAGGRAAVRELMVDAGLRAYAPDAAGPVPGWMARGALWTAVPLLGASAALIIIPSLPDMQRGLADADEQGRARMCAVWNGAYSAGSAVGPLVATALYARVGWPVIITAKAAVCAVGVAVLLVPAWRCHGRCRRRASPR